MKKTYVIFACIIIVAVTVSVLVYALNLQTPLFQTVKLEISNVAGSSMEKSVCFDVKNVGSKNLTDFYITCSGPINTPEIHCGALNVGETMRVTYYNPYVSVSDPMTELYVVAEGQRFNVPLWC